MSRYFNREGQSITRDEWAELHTEEYKRVAQTDLGDLGLVSTVWLGLDHRWDEGPREIFETLVFGGALADEMRRYATEAAAKTGHGYMVKRVRDERDELERIASKPEVQEALELLTAVGIDGAKYQRLLSERKDQIA